MKIALVSAYDFAYPGGVTDHIAHLADHFERLGHVVRIIAPWSGSGGDSPTRVIYRVGTVVPVPANGSVARITFSPTIDHRVKQILHHEQFDVVHLHEPLMPVLPLVMLRRSTAVNVGTFHAYRPDSPAYQYGRLFLEPFFRRLHGRIAVSRPARDLVSHYFAADYEIIPNGIDLARFGEHVEPFGQLRDGRPTILFVGRFNEPRKGLRYLLRALPAVRRVFPTTRLVVVGAGDPARYRRYLAATGREDVIFTGCVSPADLPRYYASCDLFCAPSIGRESFGIVLLEAIASGRPVVASAIPGYAAVIRDGQEGRLVAPADAGALATALIELLADHRLRARMAEQGRRRAAEYDWEKICRRVLRYYREVAVPEQRLTWGRH